MPCPGYEPTLKWSTKYEVLQSETADIERKKRQGKQRRSKWPGALFDDFSRSPTQETGVASQSTLTEVPSGSGGDLNWTSTLDFDDIHEGIAPMSSSFSVFDGELRSPSMTFLDDDPSTMPMTSTAAELNGGNDIVDMLELATSPSHTVDHDDSGSKEESELVLQGSASTIIPRAAPGLRTMSTMLVEFYFKETAQMYSCYDSQMNPFRTTVSRLWDSSPVIHSTLQSMAASCLVDMFPQMASLGRQLRNNAVSMLSPDTLDDHALLSLMMLGGTANWVDSGDLGVTLFNAFKHKLSSVSQSTTTTNNLQFFQDSLVYWEMLLCYVSDNIDMSNVPLIDTTKHYFPSRHIPHPWTGIARDTQIILQEVGRLIRRQRLQAHSRAFVSQAQIKRLQQAMNQAAKLEHQLINMVIPAEADVISPEDHNTPVWHLVNIAEVYRRTGLVQLYHVFPDLLAQRLETEHNLGQPSSSALLAFGQESCQQISPTEALQWLTQYAMDTLALLKKIPVESGTRDFQPFLLVALSSELRLPFSSTPNDHQHTVIPELNDSSTTLFPKRGDGNIFSSTKNIDLSNKGIQVARMRDFVQSRLTSLLHGLPPSPIRVCLQLVKETWAQMDRAAITTMDYQNALRQRWKTGAVDDLDHDGAEAAPVDIYWMDVMIQNKWEFIV